MPISPSVFMDILDDICARIKACEKGFFNEDVLSALFSLRDNLARALAEIAEENRLLRIGVVGSVKAGKSTFLNALFFNGQPVLPRAATPMTASLTRIRFGKEPKATLVFYSQKDWERIREQADEGRRLARGYYDKARKNSLEEKARKFKSDSYHQNRDLDLTPEEEEKLHKATCRNVPEALRACMELVDCLERLRLDPYEYLGKKRDLAFSSFDEVRSELEAHIGSNGKLTPLVRQVELSLNHDLLREIEIFDTPGLNDPVVSRSEEAKKHLGLCDIVFFLSPVSHFLGGEDMDFIRRALPEEGIRHAVIVASQLDSGALDLINLPFEKAYKESGRTAKRRFDELCKDLPPKNRPVFAGVSALLACCAHKKENGLSLDREEEHIFKLLQRNYPDLDLSPQSLRGFSNMGLIAERDLPEARARREEIKKERQAELIRAKQDAVEKHISALIRSTQSFQEDLQGGDIASMERQGKAISEGLESIKADVSGLFETAAAKARNEAAILKQQIIEEIRDYLDIAVDTTEESITTHSESGWWLWKKHQYDTTVTKTHTASLAGALSQLRGYSARMQGKVNDCFNTILNINGLKDAVKQKVLNLFAICKEKFSEGRILGPLEASLSKLSVPKFYFDNEPYNLELRGKYPDDKAVNEKIHTLKSDLELTLQQLGMGICGKLDSDVSAIDGNLSVLASEFISKISGSIQNDINVIKEMLRDKENNVAKCKAVLDLLKECLLDIRKVRDTK